MARAPQFSTKAQSPGISQKTTIGKERGGGITILRAPQTSHMKEIVNLGQTSNRRFTVKPR